MIDHLTTAQLADRLDITISRVHQLAAARDYEPIIIAGRCFWPREAVDILKPGKTGRPKKESE